MHQLTASDAAARIHSGKLTSLSLVSACLARIEAREAEVGAWQYIDPDLAIEQARTADRSQSRGPLHGVPIGVKDIIDTVDMPTTLGSAIYEGRRPQWDALITISGADERLLQVGEWASQVLAAT
ncbi:MAG: amidase family protein [Vicinamibacterales bacterium]